MTRVARILLAGLPEAGKSTFAAALRQIAEASDIPGCLQLDRLGDDDSAINAMREQWLQCMTFERTDQSLLAVPLRMRLKDPVTNCVIELDTPDLSGEYYSRMWEKRQCDDTLASLIRNADGVLFFVNHQKVTSVTRIADAARVMPPETECPLPGTRAPVAWNPKSASTQVKCVDLLQQIIGLRDGRGVPLTVVASAWDEMIALELGEPLTPAAWLAKRLPLLSQYLKNAAEWRGSAVVGVSAQGGKWPEQVGTLLDRAPSERPFWVDGTTPSHDLTQLLRRLVFPTIR